MSKGQNEMAKRVLLSTLNVGDKFTSDIKGGNFIITSKVGDRINIQDLDTGKETFFGSGSYMVEPIREEAPQQTYTFRQPEYMDDPEYGEKSAQEIYTESKKARKSLKEEVIVIHHPWGEEIKDYKAGDPIPAGTKFKIFKTRDQKAIDAWIDSLYESVSSRNHKFKPEELKVGKKVIDKVGGKEVHGKITVNHHDLYKDNPYTQDKKGSTVVTVVTDSGRSYDVDANDNGGEFILEGCKGKKKVKEDSDYQKERFEEPSYMEEDKMGLITDVKVGNKIKYMGKELKIIQKNTDFLRGMDKDGNVSTLYITKINDPIVIKESRIAKGYENLTAEERAKHLLSHPTSKYMSDLKSENITERAIRKAVKEMLAQPDKRDPQFITDVNEEGEAPAIANTTAEVANPELPLKLKEEDVEDSYKYQTSVAGGMGTDAENAPSAKEYDDEVLMIKEHKNFRKFLKESVGQKLNITLIRKPQNMKEVESDMRAGHGDRVKAVVDKSYTLSKSEYEAFVYNFYRHTTYLSGEGGVDPDGTVHVVEIKAPGKKTIYVDPEGYDYARYVGW